MARWLKKPVIVYAQGIGPVSRKRNQLLVKKIFESVQLITVRDSYSKKSLESFGVLNPIKIVPDPVMAIDPTEFQSKWLADKNTVQKKLVVSVRAWRQDLSYLKKIAVALDSLAAKEYSIVLVPMHGVYDEKTSHQLKRMMQEHAYIVPRECSLNEKIAIVKEADVLLGMRLHALIFAAIGNTPFVALSYDPKIDAFASIVNQKLVGNIKDNNWNAADIIGSVEEIMNNYSEEKAKLKDQVSKLKKQSNHVMQDLIKSIND